MIDSSGTVPFSPLKWAGDRLLILDQTRLPIEETWLDCDDVEEVAAAIRRLSIRGAPAIGVAAAYGLVVGLGSGEALDVDVARLRSRFRSAYQLLAATRPTAVNLQWALDLGRQIFERAVAGGASPQQVRAKLESWALELQRTDIEANRRIGAAGATLFESGDRVLTHCNAGALATGGYGTALGIVRAAAAAGREVTVLAGETRPFLQGARLTAWELFRDGIPVTVITDSMAGHLMRRKEVDLVLVGADRVAANGDVANKIGTYTLAVLARQHGIPFFVAAPRSTIDLETPSGDAIPIEERGRDEVAMLAGVALIPDGVPVRHPAFDVTPAELVTGIVTERGIALPPFGKSLARLVQKV